MSEWLEPAGLQAIFAGAVGFIAGIGVAVAYRQLRHIARPARLQGLEALYAYFDDPEKRNLRRTIHANIPPEGAGPPPEDLSWVAWDANERTATSLDVVGIMLEKDMVDEDLVMERYLEVIIPLWRKVQPYIEFRRRAKGAGWRYFETLYERAEKYRQRKYPSLTFPTFLPPAESLPTHSRGDAMDIGH